MTKDRKHALLQLLKEAPKALNGQSLAEHFHVTRQIIVQDIAILRADGAPILSTNRGYIYKQIDTNPYVHKLFKVKHEVEEIGQELLAIVDNGGRVQNTLIDHPVYGEIETLLKLSCRRDVQHFLEQVEHSDFRPLSELTDGIHYHLVEAETQQDLHYIEEALDQLGYLVKDQKIFFSQSSSVRRGQKNSDLSGASIISIKGNISQARSKFGIWSFCTQETSPSSEERRVPKNSVAL